MEARTAPAGEELVGRARELDSVMQGLTRAVDGESVGLQIYGEPGIGKTTLARAAVGRAGMEHLWVSVDQFTERRPFGPVLEALQAEPGASTWDASSTASLAGQILGGIRQRITGSGLVMIVDGVQWADEATLQLLPRLCSELRHQPFALLTTGYRQLLPYRWQLMSHGSEPARASELTLGPLSAAECAVVAERILRRRATAAETATLERAGGNPLLIERLAHRLSRSAPGNGQMSVGDIPHLQALSRDCLQFLQLASLLREGFDGHQLTLVSGLEAPALLPLVREAVSWGLLEEEASGLLRFRHAVVRAALSSELPVVVRSELHRNLARTLDTEGGPASLVAHHLLKASVGWSDPEWVRAVADRCASTAPALALALWKGLIRQADHLSEAQRVDIEANIALCQLSAGELTSAERTAGRLLETDRRIPQRSALRSCVGQSLILQGRWSDARVQAEASALSDDLFPWERAEQAGMAGLAALLAGDARGALQASTRAERVAQASGSDKAMMWVLVTRGHLAHLSGDLSVAVGVLRQAAEISERQSPRERCEVFAHGALGLALADMDRLDEALDVFGEAERLARESGSVTAQRVTQMLRTWVPPDAEHLDSVRGALGQVIALPDEVLAFWQPREIARRALVEMFRDGPDGAETWLRRIPAASTATAGYGMAWHPRALAAVREARGDAAGALTQLWTGWEAVTRSGILVDQPVLAVDLAAAAVHEGNVDRARLVAASIEELTAMNPQVASVEMVALTCRGLADDDPSALVAASAVARTSPRAVAAADTFKHAALAVARSGYPADASELARWSVRRYTEAGAGFEATRARAVFREAGIKVRTPPPRRPRHGWESLTPAERDIARLVERGMSNGEIARQRTVSRRTVETHVSHILAKLGMRSRSELIVAARRPDEPRDARGLRELSQ